MSACEATFERRRTESLAKYNAQVAECNHKYEIIVEDLRSSATDAKLARIDARHDAELARIDARHDAELTRITMDKNAELARINGRQMERDRHKSTLPNKCL